MRRRSHRSSYRKTSGDEQLPVGFIDHLGTVLGESFPGLEAALNAPAPTSIRLNPKKPFEADLDPVPWCTTGRYVVERPAFTLDPFFHGGAYYVQEASSMLLEKAVAAAGLLSKNILALDLCAAPGGKSTHLLSLLGDGALLVANERDHQRKLVLAENIWKFGAGHSMITGSNADALRSLPDLFDLILVDAPCSGEGMFRKDPFARRQWSPLLVEQCASVQQQVVPHAWHALAPGGTLIYSTCTWEPSENEAQLRPLLEDSGTCLDLHLDGSWGVARYERMVWSAIDAILIVCVVRAFSSPWCGRPVKNIRGVNSLPPPRLPRSLGYSGSREHPPWSKMRCCTLFRHNGEKRWTRSMRPWQPTHRARHSLNAREMLGFPTLQRRPLACWIGPSILNLNYPLSKRWPISAAQHCPARMQEIRRLLRTVAFRWAGSMVQGSAGTTAGLRHGVFAHNDRARPAYLGSRDRRGPLR
ncbi:MAG: RsmB/NOP family class I SAM-dependent RNA methyltransferase [Flavobacteriales bacterium]|nr:RsmB/NOP family class I SAM-dependent RNA methyltransferase [Flavobacteriales bacterium]